VQLLIPSAIIPHFPRAAGRFALCLLVLFAVSPAHPASLRAEEPQTDAAAEQAEYTHGVVAADHPLASAAGIEMLRQGGNVVDAAVATSFALSVVRPSSCGLGGGGFMLIWNAGTRSAVAIDYRERAPRLATRTMFTDAARADRNADEPSRVGHLAVAVPGTAAGLCFALEKYGTLDLKTVLKPALRLARDGFEVDRHDREVQKLLVDSFAEHPGRGERFSLLRRAYLNNGDQWPAGARFVSPQGAALRAIAEQGARGFYGGPVAEAIVAEMQRGGGILDRDDLSAMQPVERRPLRGTFDGCEVYAMPPPSSGGVALIEALHILQAWEAAHPDARIEAPLFGDALRAHLLAETLKYVFADRARYLGDADFVNVPVETLTSRERGARIAAQIDPKRTRPAADYGALTTPDDAGTSHFSVIDRHGNAVACTETINLPFGSLVVVPEFGIVLNNEMDDFAAEPGKPNAFGLMQSEANAVAPRKKPLSSMCPTIVVRDGKAVHVLGASGGPRIISATLQVLLRLERLKEPPRRAVTEPRLHHQWLPDVLELDEGLQSRLAAELEGRGHRVGRLERSSAVQAASRGEKGLSGGSDPRKGGRPAGY